MSEERKADTCCCASCGTAEVDDVKLRACSSGCDLVKYCSDGCRENHKSEHEEECKKRVAELRDELLFKQPESTHMGDCPICMVPLAFDSRRFMMYACCSKSICKSCTFMIAMREVEMRLRHSCPFCREPVQETDKQRMKRVEMNDPVAMYQEGMQQKKKGHYSRAFEYFTKAAELEDAQAHYQLALMYYGGVGAEKDEGKGIQHLERGSYCWSSTC